MLLDDERIVAFGEGGIYALKRITEKSNTCRGTETLYTTVENEVIVNSSWQRLGPEFDGRCLCNSKRAHRHRLSSGLFSSRCSLPGSMFIALGGCEMEDELRSRISLPQSPSTAIGAVELRGPYLLRLQTRSRQT